MDARRWLAVAVIALGGASFAGCIASQYPLSEEKDSVADGRLVGHWESTFGGRKASLDIGRVKDRANLLEWVRLTHDAAGFIEVARVPFYTTTIGGVHYASLKGYVLTCPDFMLLKYEVHGDSMSFEDWDSAAVEAAIEQGRLKGTISKDEKGVKSVKVTATTEELTAYVKAAGPTIWLTPMEFERVK